MVKEGSTQPETSTPSAKTKKSPKKKKPEMRTKRSPLRKVKRTTDSTAQAAFYEALLARLNNERKTDDESLKLIATCIDRIDRRDQKATGTGDVFHKACLNRGGMKEDDPLPMPFELSNPKVTKAVWFWPIYFRNVRLTRGGILDAHGLPGPYADAFLRAAEAIWPDGSAETRKNLLQAFQAAAYLWLNSQKSTAGDILDVPGVIFFLESHLKRARDLVVELDAEVLNAKVGPKASEDYRISRTVLDEANFASADVETLRRVLKTHGEKKGGKKNEKPDKQTPKDRICHKCKKTVPVTITMKAHRADATACKK